MNILENVTKICFDLSGACIRADPKTRFFEWGTWESLGPKAKGEWRSYILDLSRGRILPTDDSSRRHQEVIQVFRSELDSYLESTSNI